MEVILIAMVFLVKVDVSGVGVDEMVKLMTMATSVAMAMLTMVVVSMMDIVVKV